ncbi:hypothetical protein A2480_01460 [Candidatus Uhrbacteria bacterium RIFOXYC2_FULL_47_19]|uniref:NAD-dependent epimerase/dehydratase domain-containing protein n=1 Tax=Candidatus Uhrbacteria bacterium RIFOXYC2_FULL_47_19 TaxID=1802424 RepID=A0A1F7WCG5_9BACT|nr:MAG: hypothetical protein A2480_01460 [Candidatus Uhrbacteria bacterium RIFOXYC2_FULL_47_19]HCC22277.1 hypothetical protein [Candidatus Uhrbacteria bacterium]
MSDGPIFEKKNVLVTGGAGFIGSFLCERLLRDSKVICLDNFSTSQHSNISHLLKNPDFEFIRADVNSLIDLAAYPELERFKVRFQGVQEVYHLACPTSPKNFDRLRQDTMLANSVGVRNILELALRYGAKFFQASTPAAYGARPEDGHSFHEDEYGSFNHLTPRGCYDEGKRFAETLCTTYNDMHGLDVRVGRIFRTYGPRMALSDGHMIPDFVLDAIDGRDLVVYGDDSFKSSLIYVSDVVDAIVLIMARTVNPGYVNIGSDYEVTMESVARKILDLTHSDAQVELKERLPYMVTLGVPDLSKLKGLGWIPLVSLEQGLSKTIEYAIAHKDTLRPTFG